MDRQYSTRFEHILAEALQLSPLERTAIIERLAASFSALETSDTPRPGEDDQGLSEQEVADLMRVEPRSPADIAVEGLLGTCADLDIADGAEWVNEQKRKRRARRTW